MARLVSHLRKCEESVISKVCLCVDLTVVDNVNLAHMHRKKNIPCKILLT